MDQKQHPVGNLNLSSSHMHLHSCRTTCIPANTHGCQARSCFKIEYSITPDPDAREKLALGSTSYFRARTDGSRGQAGWTAFLRRYISRLRSVTGRVLVSVHGGVTCNVLHLM